MKLMYKHVLTFIIILGFIEIKEVYALTESNGTLQKRSDSVSDNTTPLAGLRNNPSIIFKDESDNEDIKLRQEVRKVRSPTSFKPTERRKNLPSADTRSHKHIKTGIPIPIKSNNTQNANKFEEDQNKPTIENLANKIDANLTNHEVNYGNLSDIVNILSYSGNEIEEYVKKILAEQNMNKTVTEDKSKTPACLKAENINIYQTPSKEDTIKLHEQYINLENLVAVFKNHIEEIEAENEEFKSQLQKLINKETKPTEESNELSNKLMALKEVNLKLSKDQDVIKSKIAKIEDYLTAHQPYYNTVLVRNKTEIQQKEIDNLKNLVQTLQIQINGFETTTQIPTNKLNKASKVPKKQHIKNVFNKIKHHHSVNKVLISEEQKKSDETTEPSIESSIVSSNDIEKPLVIEASDEDANGYKLPEDDIVVNNTNNTEPSPKENTRLDNRSVSSLRNEKLRNVDVDNKENTNGIMDKLKGHVKNFIKSNIYSKRQFLIGNVTTNAKKSSNKKGKAENENINPAVDKKSDRKYMESDIENLDDYLINQELPKKKIKMHGKKSNFPKIQKNHKSKKHEVIDEDMNGLEDFKIVGETRSSDPSKMENLNGARDGNLPSLKFVISKKHHSSQYKRRNKAESH